MRTSKFSKLTRKASEIFMSNSQDNGYGFGYKAKAGVMAAIFFGFGILSGCSGLATAIYEDTPFGEIDMARQRAKAPKIYIDGKEVKKNDEEVYGSRDRPRGNVIMTNEEVDALLREMNSDRE